MNGLFTVGLLIGANIFMTILFYLFLFYSDFTPYCN